MRFKFLRDHKSYAVMGPYPDLRLALPTNYALPTTTSRILRPAIVFASILILAAVTVAGFVIAGLVFSDDAMPMRTVGAAQFLESIASLLSLIYLGLHFVAARRNEPVGAVRPPEVRVHAMCFIVARLGLVMWLASVIATAIIISRPETRGVGSRGRTLQVVDMVNSNLGFLTMGVILTALEACQYPFQMPLIFQQSRGVASRTSIPSDELFHRSVSTRVPTISDRERTLSEAPKTTHSLQVLERNEVASSNSSTVDEIVERPMTPLLPMPQRSTTRVRGWGEEWTHSNEKSITPAVPKSDSGVSLSRKTSSGFTCNCDKSSDISASSSSSDTSRKSGRSRTVTPSSSISNLTRRSPLSSVRSAAYPDILIRPEVLFLAPKMPTHYEWSGYNMSTIPQPSSISSLQHYSSIKMPAPLNIRKQRQTRSKELPLIPRKSLPKQNLTARRTTKDIHIPGAFLDFEYGTSLEHDRDVDEHISMIEVEYVKRSESGRNRPKSGILEAGPESGTQAPTRGDSRGRYRPNGTLERSKTGLNLDGSEHEEKKRCDDVENETGSRRLSLGQISPGLGISFA